MEQAAVSTRHQRLSPKIMQKTCCANAFKLFICLSTPTCPHSKRLSRSLDGAHSMLGLSKSFSRATSIFGKTLDPHAVVFDGLVCRSSCCTTERHAQNLLPSCRVSLELDLSCDAIL